MFYKQMNVMTLHRAQEFNHRIAWDKTVPETGGQRKLGTLAS